MAPSSQDDLDALRERMQQARWRFRTAAPGGAEWDAAAALVETIEATIRAERLKHSPAASEPARQRSPRQRR